LASTFATICCSLVDASKPWSHVLLNIILVHTEKHIHTRVKMYVWDKFRNEKVNAKCLTLKVTPLGIVKCQSGTCISQLSCKDHEARNKTLRSMTTGSSVIYADNQRGNMKENCNFSFKIW
jgi:hypothetical protein